METASKKKLMGLYQYQKEYNSRIRVILVIKIIIIKGAVY